MISHHIWREVPAVRTLTNKAVLVSLILPRVTATNLPRQRRLEVVKQGKWLVLIDLYRHNNDYVAA